MWWQVPGPQTPHCQLRGVPGCQGCRWWLEWYLAHSVRVASLSEHSGVRPAEQSVLCKGQPTVFHPAGTIKRLYHNLPNSEDSGRVFYCIGTAVFISSLRGASHGRAHSSQPPPLDLLLLHRSPMDQKNNKNTGHGPQNI